MKWKRSPMILFSLIAESMRPPAHHVAMMQIDCEVMNTKLIHIKEDAIPHHMMAAHQMMNNNSGSNKQRENRSDTNANASIEQMSENKNEQMVNSDHNESKFDAIHSYYHNGYNLSYLNIRNQDNNDSTLSPENVSNNDDDTLQYNALEHESYANSSNGEYSADGDELMINGDDSPNSILQRTPGIVPRRFNKNAKVRETGFADGWNANH